MPAWCGMQLSLTTAHMDIQSYMHGVGREARRAAREMARAQTRAKDDALLGMAAAIERDSARLLEANRQDVEAARAKGIEAAMIDRLTLTPKSVAAMAEGLRQIAQLRDPVGEITDLATGPPAFRSAACACRWAWSPSSMKPAPTSPRTPRACA